MTPKLAIFGEAPAFDQPLYVGRPYVGDRKRLLDRIEGALDRVWLTNAGPLCDEFEQRVCDIIGVKHCVAMCNGTVALEIAARALGLTGEVIVPSFTFIATAHALQWQEITPVFCDIDPETHNLDPVQVERMITPRTSGIVGVHVWGRPCAIEPLREVADRHGLRLMFDAAHAFACSHGGRMLGGFGDVEVFSFHATKFMNTFEGGSVVTNDDEIAIAMRYMRNFGFAGEDDVRYLGTNGKLNEISAAMGLTSLDAIDDVVARNRENMDTYHRVLGRLPGLALIDYDRSEHNNYQYVVLEVDEAAAGLTRNELTQVLHAENVKARRYFHPGCHQMEPYRSLFPHAGLLLPHTERLTDRVMVLPTGMEIDAGTIERIAHIVETAIAHAPEVRAGLALQEDA
ncbi:MAG: aminotransferase class I/II-fold pyridoxal phosphate-dependent enzyme [Myxococcota bacterium]